MLVIIRGVPGAGKSTYAAKHYPGILHLENDMYHMKNGEYKFNPRVQKFAVNWCYETAKAALKAGMDVVVSNTFTKKSFVDKYVQLDPNTKVIRLETQYGNIHNVPDAVQHSMKDTFEDYPGEEIVK